MGKVITRMFSILKLRCNDVTTFIIQLTLVKLSNIYRIYHELHLYIAVKNDFVFSKLKRFRIWSFVLYMLGVKIFLLLRFLHAVLHRSLKYFPKIYIRCEILKIIYWTKCLKPHCFASTFPVAVFMRDELVSILLLK